jgi:predicted N-acetyltransferase YhbS
VSVDVRLLTAGDDLDAELDLGQRAFGSLGPGERDDRLSVVRASVGAGRHIGAFDSGVMVGSARWLDMRQWWYGRSLPMAGVAAVKVAPEHQGRGIGRAVMTGLLAEIAAQGYALSALYPATNSLYRSVGWEMAGGRYDVTVPIRSLFSLQASDPLISADDVAGIDGGAGAAGPGAGSGAGAGGGAAAGAGGGAAGGAAGGRARVRRGGPADAAKLIAIESELYAAARDCGPITYDAPTLASLLDNPDIYCYLGSDGALSYRWNRPADEMVAYVVAAGSAAATRELWSILASHGTMVGTVRAFVNPANPVSWLVRDPAVILTRRNMWMLRLVDAPAAIAGRGYPASTDLRVPLRIQDAQLPANSGSWLLEITGGKAALTRYDPAAGGLAASGGSGGLAGFGASTGSGASGGLAGFGASTGSGASGGLAGFGTPLRLGVRGLAAMYAGTPLATLRIAGLAAGGTPDADAALDDAFAGTAYMFDYF